MMPSPSTPPIGSPAFFRNPYPTYRALLDDNVRVVRLSPAIVAVTHYQDCLDVLRDPRLSAKRYVRGIAHYTEEQKKDLADWILAAQNQMFFMDAPEHTRVRKLLVRAFAPETVSTLIPRIEAVFRDLLNGLRASEEFDFMRRVAHPFPALVIGEILGVPHDGWDRLMAWSDIFIEFVATFQAPFSLALEARRATVEMIEYMGELVEVKRRQPGADVITMMLEERDEGSGLSHAEVLAQCMLLLVAGHETTRNLIGNGLLTLLRHPEDLRRLAQDPSLGRSAVEEFLRYESPLQGTSRVAMDDLEFHGEKVLAGQSMLSLMGCANRDGRQFPDPDRIDLARKNNAHLTFGAGAHACLGLHLARIEAQIAFRELLARYPHIELRESEPQWGTTLTLRGLKRLNVAIQ